MAKPQAPQEPHVELAQCLLDLSNQFQVFGDAHCLDGLRTVSDEMAQSIFVGEFAKAGKTAARARSLLGRIQSPDFSRDRNALLGAMVAIERTCSGMAAPSPIPALPPPARTVYVAQFAELDGQYGTRLRDYADQFYAAGPLLQIDGAGANKPQALRVTEAERVFNLPNGTVSRWCNSKPPKVRFEGEGHDRVVYVDSIVAYLKHRQRKDTGESDEAVEAKMRRAERS